MSYGDLFLLDVALASRSRDLHLTGFGAFMDSLKLTLARRPKPPERGKENAMEADIVNQIQGLRRVKVRELRDRYKEIFGEESRSNHREFLFRRIAWRLQALAEGDISERARQRAAEIAQDADLRICGPKPVGASPGGIPGSRQSPSSDRRLPLVGTMLTREYKNHRIAVQVLDGGFQYEDRFYKSLSAIAREVTGTQWNGYLFFGLKAGTQR
jgi:Protein of unknown function (DUF2924)